MMMHTYQSYGLRLKWLGCACFELDFGGITVVNDPWITGNHAHDLTWEAVENCDYITLTHGHFDHTMDIPALMEKFHARILCGEFTAVPLLRWAQISPMRICPMHPDLELDFDAVKIKALYGRHIPLAGTPSEREERARTAEGNLGDPNLIELAFWGDLEYRNYLYTLPSGIKILIWGNKLLPEQRNILRKERPDVAILQVTGANSPAETAALLKEIGCKVVLPHHFDFPRDYSQKVEELGSELKQIGPEIRYIIPEYNRWIEL
jgi:L-ascorbate metabolism protein UlaG (beta-lactamase superfamily)